MDERKKHDWPFCFAVGARVVVAYLLSWGPAAWYVSNIMNPSMPQTKSNVFFISAFRVVYYPLYQLYGVSPEPIQNAMYWYVNLYHEVRL